MRGLAAFAMSGRARALLLAIATAGSLLFAWIAAGLVALVTLRKGYGEGIQLMLWASLPGLVLTRVTGDSSVLALIVGTGLLALVLRATMSLVLTALLSAVVALLSGAMMLTLGDAMLDELVRVFGEFLAALEEQSRNAGGEPVVLVPPTRLQLAGMLGTANGALSFLCLALGRYWQAALYNPGGFGEEFRALRLPPAVVWALVLGATTIAALGISWRSWAAALLLPLTVAGFALLHARARVRGQGRVWIGALYVAWAVFDAAKLALVGLVLADTVLDFRRRWGGGDVGGDDGGDDGDSGSGTNAAGASSENGDGAGEESAAEEPRRSSGQDDDGDQPRA